mgnify:CR=1 FL=1
MSVKHNGRGQATVIYDQDPTARRVYLAGDFNSWDPEGRRMVKVRGGTFNARLNLQPGRYEYKFIVDGQWCHDVTADQQVQNSQGTFNSVLQV